MAHRKHPAVQFAGILAALWVAFYFAWRELPYVRAGAAVVHAAKESQEREGRIFPPGTPVRRRLIVFGNSKALTGFIPAVFDSASPHGVYSANMGTPGETQIAADLETLARTGELPHYVVLTLPWPAGETPAGDDRAMDRLFPFRKFPRDLILFTLLARNRGGTRAFYRHGAEVVREVERARGWYFIEGQSHYPDNRLPDDFRLSTDDPGRTDDPAFRPAGAEFTRINNLAEKYNLRIFLAPSYHRQGQLAPSPAFAASLAARMKGWSRFRVAGPSYFLFPNRYFADPVHLNPEGARLYTGKLAEILAYGL